MGPFFICVVYLSIVFENYPWFVTPDRALSVDRHGGCWVELSRLVENEELGQVFEELDCSFYGPVECWD